MNMIKTPTLLIGSLLLCICMACSNSAIEKETPNGFKFQVVKTGDGILPKGGQLMILDYTIKDSKDSVWVDTYDTGIPAVVQIQDSTAMPTEIGMMQMFRMLSVADSVTVTKPVKAFFKDVLGAPLPPEIDTTVQVTCNLRVSNIIEMQKFPELQTQIYAKRKGKQKAKDLKKIDDYLTKNNITAQQDTSGIRYVIHKTNGGQKPTAENCVEVAYEGKFLENGTTFDKNEKVAFSLADVIPGWRISIPLLGIGDSATFYIPSELAYGPQGVRGGIPADAVLIFDVKLLASGSALDPQTRICK
jgi:FKBP-type peptidyl-prolyl cis-trans isomerase FkpA